MAKQLFYRYRGIYERLSEEFAQLFSQKKLYYSGVRDLTGRESLNDPLDLQIPVMENDVADVRVFYNKYRKRIDRNDNLIHGEKASGLQPGYIEYYNMQKSLLEYAISNSVILCLSRALDDAHWAGYADSHRGVAFEFEADLEVSPLLHPQPINYVDRLDRVSPLEFAETNFRAIPESVTRLLQKGTPTAEAMSEKQ